MRGPRGSVPGRRAEPRLAERRPGQRADLAGGSAEPNFLTSTPATDNLGPLVLHFAPDGPPEPAVGWVIRVRGQFDDAAATCRISIVDPLQPDGAHLVDIPAETAHLACAQQFVVETVEVLGTDPGFPLG